MLNKMLDLQKEKERIIIKGNTKELDKIVKEEIKIIEKSEKVEKDRVKLTEELARLEGREKGSITLSTLFEIFPEDKKDTIQKVAVDLTKVVSDVAKTNRSNAELLKHSLDFIDYNINLFMPVKEDVYIKSGKMKKQDSTLYRFIDKRA